MNANIEEFTIEGNNFVYIDFSGRRANNLFIEVLDAAKAIISAYPEGTLYTIANIEDTMFDSDSIKLFAEYMAQNKPYVKYGAIIGSDGIKKMMAKTALKLSGRTNVGFAFTKEQAIDWLLKQGTASR